MKFPSFSTFSSQISSFSPNISTFSSQISSFSPVFHRFYPSFPSFFNQKSSVFHGFPTFSAFSPYSSSLPCLQGGPNPTVTKLLPGTMDARGIEPDRHEIVPWTPPGNSLRSQPTTKPCLSAGFRNIYVRAPISNTCTRSIARSIGETSLKDLNTTSLNKISRYLWTSW